MPTSPEAIKRFLAAKPLPTIEVKGKGETWLNDFIYKSCRHLPTFKTKPRIQQLEGLAFALWAKRILLYYDPRTGKTKLSLDWLTFLRKTNRAQRALIIAHAPIGVDEWMGQIPVHSDLNIIAIKSGADSFEDLCEALETNCDAIIMAWSTLQIIFSVKKLKRKKNKSDPDVWKLYPDRDKLRAVSKFFDVVIIDEIHMAMSHDSLRFVMACELVANCNYRMGLTGTPFGRNPFGLWAQTFLMDEGRTLGTNYYFFLESIGDKKYDPFSRSRVKFVFPKPNTPSFLKRMEIIRNKLSHMMLSCKLTEVHDVNVLSGIIKLTMSVEQNKAYKEAISRFIEDGKNDTHTIENVFIRLRQIASGYCVFIDTDTGQEHKLEFARSAKFDWLEDFVSEVLPEKKFVIFHDFTATGDHICRVLTKAKIKHGWLYGGTKNRTKVLNDFKEGNVNWLVANIATGGTAIDLSVADHLIFFESPTSIITRKQAESRPLARGSKPLIMDDLICAPIEERLLGFAEEGRSLLNVLQQNPKNINKLLG